MGVDYETCNACEEARCEITIERLEKEVKALKRQLTMQRDNNYDRNIELDALHFVWCDGGCRFGVHRYGEHPPLTEEIVFAAERNAMRLRQWLENKKCKNRVEGEEVLQ